MRATILILQERPAGPIEIFTRIADPQRLARVADALPRQATIGRLGQVCDRWIYSACLCFGLDLDERRRSGFCYGYSVYQAEYSRTTAPTSGPGVSRSSGRRGLLRIGPALATAPAGTAAASLALLCRS